MIRTNDWRESERKAGQQKEKRRRDRKGTGEVRTRRQT